MEIRVSATELARTLGDVLGRIRYRGDTFLVERNGEPVARVVPVTERPTATLREVLAAWEAMGPPDPSFADDIDRVQAADAAPKSPWDS